MFWPKILFGLVQWGTGWGRKKFFVFSVSQVHASKTYCPAVFFYILRTLFIQQMTSKPYHVLGYKMGWFGGKAEVFFFVVVTLVTIQLIPLVFDVLFHSDLNEFTVSWGTETCKPVIPV